jgi:hypothetical protein
MDNDAKTEIICEAIEIAKSVTPEKLGDDSRIIKPSEDTFLYINDFHESYGILRGKILIGLKKNHAFPHDAFSDEYMNEFIDELIIKILNSGINEVELNPLLVDIFEKPFQEIICCLFLEGIELDSTHPTMEIGNIVLKQMTSETAENLEGPEKIMLFSPKHYIGKIYSEFKTFSEPQWAIEKAEIETSKILDLITYFIPFIYPEAHKISVGFQGQVLNTTPGSIICYNPEYEVRYWADHLKGPQSNFIISNKNLKIMEDNGFFKIAEILKKPEKEITHFEHTILLSIHWFRISQIQNDIKNEFLSLIISMEIFLTPHTLEIPITKFISESVGMILRTPENRVSIMKKIKKFYGIRSDIVHGRSTKVDPTDLNELRSTLKELIQCMIYFGQFFEKKSDLLDSIECHKTSGEKYDPSLHYKKNLEIRNKIKK